MTNVNVVTDNRIEGFHCWPNAPGRLEFLRYSHRHIFDIRSYFAVSDNDRQIEIIETQHKIAAFIKARYGDPAIFGSLSCEAIAEIIINEFPGCVSCQVLEDGMGGAIARKEA